MFSRSAQVHTTFNQIQIHKIIFYFKMTLCLVQNWTLKHISNWLTVKGWQYNLFILFFLISLYSTCILFFAVWWLSLFLATAWAGFTEKKWHLNLRKQLVHFGGWHSAQETELVAWGTWSETHLNANSLFTLLIATLVWLLFLFAYLTVLCTFGALWHPITMAFKSITTLSWSKDRLSFGKLRD